MMKLSAITLAVLVSACASAPPAAPKPTPSKVSAAPPAADEDPWTLRTTEPTRLARGKLDTSVVIVPVQSKARPSGAYLVQVNKPDDAVNGLVFLATATPFSRSNSGPGHAFRITLRGEPKFLAANLRHWGWRLWPTLDSGYRLELDRDASVDGAALLALHTSQIKSGELAKLAPADRDAREKMQETRLAKEVAGVEEACGVPVSVDWSETEDTWFDSFSIANRCRYHVLPMKTFCESYPHRIPEVKQLGRIVCRIEAESSEVVGRVTRSKSGLIIVPGKRESPIVHAETFLELEFRKLFVEEVQVLRFGKRYLVLREKDGQIGVYAGSQDKLIAQRNRVSDRSPSHRSSQTLFAGALHSKLERKGSGWELHCGEDKSIAEVVVGEERKQFLAGAQYEEEPTWKREPYYLGRDSKGTYYYVDKMHNEFGGKHHRVFMGRRGSAKLTKLVGLVEDSQGMLFSTKEGNLRLVVEAGQHSKKATWIRGKKVIELVSVPIHLNLGLIYQDLGAYYGESLGHVCE